MKTASSKSYLVPFILVTSLFFFWGFVNNLNPILIPHLKRSFSLTNLQTSLVDSAVYIGYFTMALPAGLIMRKYGYRKGIVIGLLLFAAGSFLFIPAANTQQYAFFLGALFIIACGLAILETVANPYAASLGNPDSSTRRLNLAQSFNGLAATLAPIIGARIILSGNLSDADLSGMTEAAQQAALAAEAASVKTPYLVLGSVILLTAIVFALVKLPETTGTQTASENRSIKDALRYAHLRWAIISQFFYVGAQVCVFSFFILYAVKAAAIDKVAAADYLGWGCGMAFMVGRFAGTFLMRYIKPNKLLATYALINIILSAAAMFSHGLIAVYTVIAIAFFMSIMFPTIFSLGIAGLGSDAKFGSSLIIMAIAGGAALPPVMAWISDTTGDIQMGYIVPLISFVMVCIFGLKMHRIKK